MNVRSIAARLRFLSRCFMVSLFVVVGDEVQGSARPGITSLLGLSEQWGNLRIDVRESDCFVRFSPKTYQDIRVNEVGLH